MVTLIALVAETAPTLETTTMLSVVEKLIIFVLGPIAAGIGAYLLHKSQQSTKAAVEEAKTVAQEVSRKVTSNNGHDNIGDKIDQLVHETQRSNQLAVKQVNALVHLAGCVKDLKEAQIEAAKQTADGIVSTAVSFEELAHALDEITYED